MQTLFYIGLIFVLGAFMKWISAKFGLINVVGFLILGFIIGPEALGIIDYHFVESTHIITELSLSLIAVLVGGQSQIQYYQSLLAADCRRLTF